MSISVIYVLTTTISPAKLRANKHCTKVQIKGVDTMKALFVHNNAYDTILLANGSAFTSVTREDFVFCLNPNSGIELWDGDKFWTEHGETLQQAAAAYGDLVAGITDEYRLEVYDDVVWQRRLDFYGVTSIEERKEDFLEAVKDWKADCAPQYDALDIVEFLEENGKIQAVAQDAKCRYLLEYDDIGNIVIHYLDTK